jgi:diguanylate cyclase (GGDEF)-like protein
MPLDRLSIRATVLASIVIGMVLPAALVLAVDEVLLRRAHEPLLQRKREAVLALAVAALAEPAWTLSLAGVDQAARSVLREPSVCRIDVLDLAPPSQRTGTQAAAVSHRQCDDGVPLIELESPVQYEQQTVARLRLAFDGGEGPRAMSERRAMTLSMVWVQVLFGVLVLTLVLSRRLLRPIDALKLQAGRLAARETAPPEVWPHNDELGELGQHLNTVHTQIRELVDQLEGKNRQLHQMAMHDHLTGLPNRTLLRELFSREAARARRLQQRLALLFIDLDRFKSVNDRHGHAAGDELLVSIAARIRTALRGSDLVCRASGDEFLALLPLGELDENPQAVADRLVQALQVEFKLRAAKEPVRIGASIGVALFPQDGSDFEAMVRAADVAMYRSKELGRGRSSLFQPEMDERLRERLDLERELAHGIANGELRLHYQPVVDARDGRVVGCEALVRWMHPRRGLVAPQVFIGIAESTGLVRPLGRWVLEEAAAAMARWQAAELPPLQVAVNVSALQLRDDGFVGEVGRTVQVHGLRPGALTLELTESTLLDDSDVVMRAVAGLRGCGVHLAVDDFGTGYSSLAALKLLRPDRLKIDRSFVHDLPRSADDAALVQAMFVIARALSIEVVAEGVETAGQRDWLLAQGGVLQQGWLWSKAVPDDAFVALVRQAQGEPPAPAQADSPAC